MSWRENAAAAKGRTYKWIEWEIMKYELKNMKIVFSGLWQNKVDIIYEI